MFLAAEHLHECGVHIGELAAAVDRDAVGQGFQQHAMTILGFTDLRLATDYIRDVGIDRDDATVSGPALALLDTATIGIMDLVHGRDVLVAGQRIFHQRVDFGPSGLPDIAQMRLAYDVIELDADPDKIGKARPDFRAVVLVEHHQMPVGVEQGKAVRHRFDRFVQTNGQFSLVRRFGARGSRGFLDPRENADDDDTSRRHRQTGGYPSGERRRPGRAGGEQNGIGGIAAKTCPGVGRHKGGKFASAQFGDGYAAKKRRCESVGFQDRVRFAEDHDGRRSQGKNLVQRLIRHFGQGTVAF